MRERSTPWRGTPPRRLLLSLGFFSAFWRAIPARAAETAVHVDCAELTQEQAAEIESRVRASLLTADLNASASIACRDGSARVHVESAGATATVQTSTTREGFRDELLRALDQALQQLRSAPQPESTQASPASDPEPPAAQPSLQSAPPSSAPVSQKRTPPPRQPRPLVFDEAALAIRGERWPGRWALGATFGVRRTHDWLGLGLRLGAARPLTQHEAFSATEAGAALELSATPRELLGVQLTVGLGVSVLLIAPEGDLIARHGTAKSALFGVAELSRPLRSSRLSLAPGLGLRVFGADRGVHLGTSAIQVLGGVAPYLTLAVAYRD